jgi:hypothetical protein
LIALGVDRDLVFGHPVGQRLLAVGDPLAPDQRLVGFGLGPAALVELVGEVALLEVPAARRLGGQLVLGLVVRGALGGDRAAQLGQLRGHVALAEPLEDLEELLVVGTGMDAWGETRTPDLVLMRGALEPAELPRRIRVCPLAPARCSAIGLWRAAYDPA